MSRKKKQNNPFEFVIMASILGISTVAYLTAMAIRNRRNGKPKQPVITEDAEFEVLNDKKETNLIEYKSAGPH